MSLLSKLKEKAKSAVTPAGPLPVEVDWSKAPAVQEAKLGTDPHGHIAAWKTGSRDPPPIIQAPQEKEKWVPQHIVPVPVLGTREYQPLPPNNEVVTAIGIIGRRTGKLKINAYITKDNNDITINVFSKAYPTEIQLDPNQLFERRDILLPRKVIIKLTVKKN